MLQLILLTFTLQLILLTFTLQLHVTINFTWYYMIMHK